MKSTSVPQWWRLAPGNADQSKIASMRSAGAYAAPSRRVPLASCIGRSPANLPFHISS